MIVGLAGYKGSGKDTVAAYLIKEHGFERKAFADPLKQSIAALLDIPFADVDKLKNDPTISIGFGRRDDVSTDIIPMHKPQSFREFLQRYGTESHRNIFGMDFWVDYTLPVQGFYPGRAIVVSDVRFVNEADRIKMLGGTIWCINRPFIQESDNHPSEKIDFDVDVHIQNDGTLEELYERVEEALASTPVSQV